MEAGWSAFQRVVRVKQTYLRLRRHLHVCKVYLFGYSGLFFLIVNIILLIFYFLST